MSRLAQRSGHQEFLDWLRRLFRELNEQFFSGGLPEHQICVDIINRGYIVALPVGKPIQLPWHGSDLYGWCVPDRRVIIIHSAILADKKLARQTLLHEMCHAKVYQIAGPTSRNADPHGADFIAELRRLAVLGEKWADEQASDCRNAPGSRCRRLP